MISDLHNFYAALTELLRANHGDDFVISMRDHQRKLIVRRTPDGAPVLQTPPMGTIPLTDTIDPVPLVAGGPSCHPGAFWAAILTGNDGSSVAVCSVCGKTKSEQP